MTISIPAMLNIFPRVLGALLLFAVGCKRIDEPPPVRNGSCVTLSFSGRDPQHRRCVWSGYVWDCLWNGIETTCHRRAELPVEARMVAR